MKNLAVALLTLCIMTSAAIAAPAAPAPQQFWYSYGEFDYYSGAGQSLDGGGVGVGWRIDRFLGLQGGFQYTEKSGVDVSNGYAEAMAILPLTRRLDLYGSFGGSYATASTSFDGVSLSISRSGYRAGAGVEYWFTPRWGLRLGFHRQNAGGVADDVGAGVAFRF